jgi:hypothetical protein|tara:strand:- start:29486 stop:31360 length:1875 start_codon:yes stop_codon:yes gene_type:complete
MSFNQFTNLDFADLRAQIKDYLRTNSDFSDFDFEGSNFSILIDLLAYNSYITAYNTNMAVNECFLDSATLRENVVSLARNIGYVPRSTRSARAVINFSVNMGDNETRIVTLKAGQVALGAQQGGSYIFSIPDDFVATTDETNVARFNNLNIYEGIYLQKTFQVDYSQPNQRFILPNANIDSTSIRVIVESTTKEIYTLYDNILRVDATSKLFLIQEIEDEQYELLFGDGILGKRPPAGATVTVNYIVTNGKNGNEARKFSFVGVLEDDQGQSVTSGISVVRTSQAAADGDNIEDISSIKYLAPRIYSSQYRAVTANDYTGIIPFVYPNVESVTSYGGEELDPPEYGKVFISIKPKNGSFLSQITKDDISRQLKQYSIAGIKPEIIDLKYLYVEVDTSVYYNSNALSDATELVTSVTKALTSYSRSSDINAFGGRFKYSKIVGLVDNSARGVTSNITKVKMRRDITPEINTFATYELCYGNAFFKQRNGYGIRSTGFNVSNISGTIYMGDIPIAGTDVGKIIFFKLENNLPLVVKNDAGTIDYVHGEINLDVVNITGTSLANGQIQVEAIPQSNDVIALKDLYLQLDVTNSSVNALPDVVSSGENTSATAYVTTSSYASESIYTR